MEKQQWRFLYFPNCEGIDVYALPRTIIDSVNTAGAPNTLVLIGWVKSEAPTICLGYHMDASGNLDIKKCRELGVTILRRDYYGGGGGMFFADDAAMVPFAVAKKEIFKGSLEEAVKIFTGEITVQLWKELGIKEPYYKHIGDITLEGKKLSGSDVSIIGDVIFPISYLALSYTDFDTLTKIIHLPPEKFADKEAKDMREWAMTGGKALGRTIFKEEVKDALIRAFEKVMGVKLVAGEMTEFEKERYQFHRKQALNDYATFKWSGDRRFAKEEVPEGWSVGVGRYKARKLVEAQVLIDDEGKIADVMLTGDYYCYPGDYLMLLEESLKGMDAKDEAAIKGKVEEFYKMPEWEITLVSVDEMTKPIIDACKNALK
jgi:lipoate-protein ligase A